MHVSALSGDPAGPDTRYRQVFASLSQLDALGRNRSSRKIFREYGYVPFLQ
jgi:hypothetical protein